MAEQQCLNLAKWCLDDAVRRTPGKTALILLRADGTRQSVTYAQLHQRMITIAQGLQVRGLRRDHVVMLRLPQGIDYAASLLAVIAQGAIALPLSPQLQQREIDEIHRVVEPAWVLDEVFLQSFGTTPRRAYAWVQTAAEDPCLLLFTSGTSAAPKGVLHAHRMVYGRDMMRAGWTGIQSSDIVFHAGQLNWTYTLGVALLDSWRVGATAVLTESILPPEAWLPQLSHTKATVFAAVPSLYRRILKYDDPKRHDLSALRHALCAGEPLTPALECSWRESTGKPLYEALGMTEISTYISSGPATPVRPGSPGKAQAGRRIAILPVESDPGEKSPAPLPTGEVGLLAVHRSDPGLMLGYWRAPDDDAQVRRGEWFTGGDLASLDQDGYVWFHGRSDDVLKISGYRVSPWEVEAVLAGHGDIGEVACGVVERGDGAHFLAAFVVRRPGSCVTVDEILQWTASRLAAYKQPRGIFFVDRLPRTASGKLKRRELGALKHE